MALGRRNGIASPLSRLCGYYLDCLSQEGAKPAPNDHELTRQTSAQDYTKGLEFELRSLQTVALRTYRTTALGAWVHSRTVGSSPADRHPLLEVVALNGEQRQAVQQGLSSPLTVITGPPGTGKSQVVTSILVNDARQGRTVLFPSKNHKAVDLVEARVNALGPRPVLVRLGADGSRLA